MRLCDVTLREAAQLSGREYTAAERIEAGHSLDALGVPFVQAGFPAAGPLEAETTRRLAGDIDADVVAIARAIPEDVEAALDADVIEVFVPVSEVQLEHVLGSSREEAFEAAETAILRAREGGAEVHLTLMDAFRADPTDLAAAFGRFDLPVVLTDSVGARTPPFVVGYLRTLAESGVDLSRVGVHFHDDLGCATANALAAARVGVDRVDTSVAGLGERAGNPATEEVIVATETAGESAGVDADGVIPACEDVLDALGESIDGRKAILGTDARTHGAGLHTDAMLSEPSTFEPFDPADFGGHRRLRFGEATGRGAAGQLLERAGRSPDPETIEALLEELSREGPVDLDAALSLAETV